MTYKLAQSTWGSKEIEALNKVIHDGNFTMGKNVKEFEESFASYFGSKYACAVANGTAALHSALYMADVQRGDLVVTQA